ncbi:MAG: carbohydrate kinase family protein [Streptosporangiaceae bacterium]|nr:carbohydrate kinase family protein [Streptosporangiaceae bacterium]
MRIAVTGSIATDHLMTFPGRFADQFVADKLDKVALSFLVDELQIRRGGVAANIAFGLARLGLRPLLIGSVGPDFAEYRTWLELHGVDTSGVRESVLRHTARFVATTDVVGNQIASFYPGAMSEDTLIDLAPLAGGCDLAVIGASDPQAMLSFTRQCRELGLPFAADTSWQLARFDGQHVRELVDGAAYLFSNEYEAALIEQKTGWTPADVLSHVGTRVTTLGADGARVERAGEPSAEVPGVADARMAEPTGAGDAFRSGFLAAVAWGLSLERAAQLGNLIAVHALETIGTQEYDLKPGALADRFAAAYGDAAAAEVAAYLPG